MEQPVRFLRIDDRLIHGQVIVGWVPILNVKFIVVANERIASDSMRQEMMSLSVPPGITLSFFNPTENPPRIDFSDESMVLTASPKDAWLCLQAGIKPEKLNVGGMHARPGKEEIREAFHIDAEDKLFFQKIIDSGLTLDFQPTPQNEPVPLTEIL